MEPDRPLYALQRRPLNREQDRRIRSNMYLLRLDMITRANLPAHVRMPIIHIPFQAFGSNRRGAPDWHKTDVLREQAARLQSLDDVVATFENEGQT